MTPNENDIFGVMKLPAGYTLKKTLDDGQGATTATILAQSDQLKNHVILRKYSKNNPSNQQQVEMKLQQKLDQQGGALKDQSNVLRLNHQVYSNSSDDSWCVYEGIGKGDTLSNCLYRIEEVDGGNNGV